MAALAASLGISLAAAAVAGLASRATFVPKSKIWGSLIWEGSCENPPRVALTFDDGPTPGATDRLLDKLDELNIKAAFFAIGRNAERAPALLRRIDQAGHVIGNHTFDHSRYCAFGFTRYWREQMTRADDAISQAIGKRPRLFRPPIGHKTPHTMLAAKATDHVIVTWTDRSWDGLASMTSERIVDHIVPRSRAGTIIVMHDGVEPGRQRDPSATLNALGPMVAGLRARGLEPARLDELINIPAYA